MSGLIRVTLPPQSDSPWARVRGSGKSSHGLGLVRSPLRKRVESSNVVYSDKSGLWTTEGKCPTPAEEEGQPVRKWEEQS